MAIQVLAVNGTVGETAEFTLTTDTLVWIHGSRGNDVMVALNIKGDDAKFSPLVTMHADGTSRSGVLPAGTYQAVRLRGTCGFQRAA